jgi:hypothetical protein
VSYGILVTGKEEKKFSSTVKAHLLIWNENENEGIDSNP